MEYIRKIHELEALLKQAEDVMAQLRGAVNAMKPPPKPKKKMNEAEIKSAFRKACRDVAKRK